MAVVSVLVVVVGLPLGSATAYQSATSVTQAGQTITGNTPSGWTWAATTSGANTVLDATSSPGTYAATSAMFTPSIATTAPMDRISTNLSTCPATGACSGLGTVTINLSQPVKNPVVHVMGIGAQASNGTNGTIFHITPTLTASTPAGATLGSPSAGAANMVVTGGTTIDAADYLASTSCGSMTTGATALSVCGSVPVVGTVTSLTFTITAQARAYQGSGTTSSGAADAWGLLVTAPQDFGDAPASYDAAGAAANVIGDLKLGATEDEDNATVANGTTSPNAVAGGASANGTNGDGADEDALTTWPAIPVSSIGSSYSVTVPISGAAKAGQVCGWVDFNKNGTFDAGEQACTSFAAAATSVTLTWTVPATSAGTTYARLRAAYGAATMSPTGPLDSGETEDYTLAVMPVVKVTKVLAAGSTGTFDLRVNGTTLATGVGNGGTTGTKTLFNASTYGTPDLTVSQNPATTAVPLTVAEANATGNSNSYTTTYSCVNGAGATVATGSTTSASVSIPASSGTNGTAQNISCTFTNTQAPSIALVKSVSSVTDVNGNGVRDAGDKINYSFLVTNTGGAPLTLVAVTDTKVAVVGCPSTSLGLGATMTCTATYTILQTDVDAGSVPNTATVTGTAGLTVVTATSSVTTSITASPSLSLQKSVASLTDVNGDGKNDAGDQVSWTFKVTNTGNVTISTVAVSDPKAGTITCSPTTLAPGAAVTCTAAAYTITQAEGDAGVVNNTATATGKTPSNATVTSNTSSTSTTLIRSPAITITKSAAVTDVNGNGKTDLGDRIQWSFVVKNTGNVTLTSMSVTDAKAGAVSCPATTLAPGVQTTCTATTPYTITQADVDAGSVSNTASASATPPTGGPLTSSPSSTNTPVVQTSALQLTKTAAATDVNGDGLTDLGDRITWSFLVKNTGTVTITTVAVSDPTAGTVTCSPTTLAPGAQVTCTAAAHTITQADVDAGVVSNTATATGKNPANATVTSNPSSTATAVAQTTTLALLKSAAVTDVNGNGKTDLGDKIQWSFKATNTGTVTINTLAINDAKAGAVSCPVTTLAPGAQTTCTATVQYLITQTDVDAGVVNNTATASAKNPGGSTLNSTPSSTSTPVNQVSALQLTKTAVVTDLNGDGLTDLGDRVTWSFLVKNTGTVTVTTVAVTDPAAGTVTCSPTTLAPGAQVTCTAAAHTVTQADVDAGAVNNTATAGGKNPANATVTSNSSSTSTPVNQVSALQLTKTAAVTDVNGNGKSDLGDKIQWSFVVKNTGTVTITTAAVNDAKAGPVSCPVTTLAPGAQTTCTATAQYTISQTDVDNGVVSNSAVATGKNPANATVTSNTSQTDTPVVQVPALQLTKVASATDANNSFKTDLGDTITWTFQVTNNGTTTLTGVAVSDPTAGAVSCPTTTLAPGASTTCTAAAHTISQADVDAGVVNNTATATAKNPANATVTSNPSSTSTPVNQVSTLQLTKSAAVTDVNGNGKTDLGDRISWSFVVKNTGTVTLAGTAVTDPKAGATSCPVTTLTPGSQTTCTATTPYTITQTDVDAAVVTNTATATALNPASSTVTSNPSSTSTPVVQTSALQLTKSAAVTDVNGNGQTDLGDRIQWTFVVKNTGTATITAVAVSDASAGAVSCPATTLAPGGQTTCTATATRAITQSDVDAGVVTNTATVTGKNPAGSTVTSNPSSTDTTVAQSPGLQLTKSAAVTDVNGNGKTDLGDRIAWSFLVKNVGTVTVHGIAISDAKAGAVSCPTTTLAPGASTTCAATAAYTIAQGDVDAGHVDNTATASGLNPGGGAVTSNSSSTSTPVAQANSLLLTKSATVTDVDGDFVIDRGDKIQWSFLVKNTGTGTITAITVNDPFAGAITCPVTSLTPGSQTTCTASTQHVISQAEVDAGVVNNTATTSGVSPLGTTITSNPSSTSTPVTQSPALKVTKSATVTDANGNGPTDLGDTVTWSFLVQNTGTVTLTGVAVSDATAGAVSCPATTLAPGAQTTCSAAGHTVTQAEVDAGVVSNTATASGQTPSAGTVTSPPSSTDTPVAQSAALALAKSAAVTDVNGNGATDLGDRIQWSFLVRNTGTVTLTAVAVSDAKAGAVSCPTSTLAPGASTMCTATSAYTISQADVDAGVVTNTATASGKSPANATVTSSPSSTNTPVARAAALSLTKSAATTDVNGNGKTDLGDRIAWSFQVRNTGTSTITSIAVTDPKAGAVSCPATTLAPGATTTCTAAAHTVTQADVDAGVVTNTATVSGKDPANATVTSSPSSTSTPVVQTASMTLTKSASVSDVNGNFKIDLGDRITWTLLVKNTGTTTINTVAVSDPTAGPVSCPLTTLAPGAQTTCTVAVHPISQADVDAGIVSNTATASAKDPQGNPVAAGPSTADTPVDQNSGIQVTKNALVTDIGGDGQTDLGDKITWSFLVRNTGSVTLTPVGINDPKAGSVSCPTTTLAPGGTTTCTAAAYTITQTDVDAGVVANTATASGRNPSGTTITSTSSSTTTPVAQTSSLQLTKSASGTDLNGNGRTDLGDRITWSFLVKNTGSTTLSSVAVSDPTAGVVSCPTTTLAPGASTTCTSSAHPITQAEVDAGVVSNTATATAKNPGNGTVTSNPSSTDTPVTQAPGVTLTKSATVADIDGDGRTDLGDRLAWSFLVRNTGTTTVTGVAVSDPKAGAVSCPVTTLAPGAATTCTATGAYTITQPDVDAGHVGNTATASAQDSKGNPLTSPPSSTDTPVAQSPNLSLVKSAATLDVNADFKIDLGDTITWSFLVKNTGTVTVSGLIVTDPKAGALTCPTTTLAPGGQTTCTSSAYPITQSDVDAGVVTNTATATASTPGGATVTSPPSSTDTPVAQVTGLSLAKSAAVTDVNGNGGTDLGDAIQWSFVVTNAGTTTTHALVVNDPKAGPVSCPGTTLAPGASTTCTSAPYTITQADVDAGHVANTATASATTPSGAGLTSPPSSTDTPVDQTQGVSLAKAASVTDVDADGGTDLGDTITWSFTLTNTGTTSVSGLAIADPIAGAVSCPLTMLAPGAATVCTSGAHTISQADVDAGVVSNTATAGGQDPQGRAVTSAPSSTDTPVAQAPALGLVKAAAVTDVNADGRTDLTDRITWAFTVTNSGTATLTGLVVTDPTAGAVSCPVTTLAPGASTTCTSAPYTITQPDVDTGHVDNTATAAATAPDGSSVPSNQSSVSTPVSQRPNPALTKTATVTDNNGNFRIDLGDTINWSFLVENTGNVTLDSVQVTDPTAGPVSCPSTVLAVGATMTCTAAPHVISQADVDAGFVANTAWSSGHAPSIGTSRSNDSSTDTPVDQRPALAVTKSAAVTDVDTDGRTDLGDTIRWSFLVENTGTVTMTAIAVDDAKAGSVTCPVITLAPGETTSCVADNPYVVDQADVDAGQVVNTATVSGEDPSGGSHTSAPSSTDTTIDQSSGLAITKAAAVTDVDGDGATDLGDRITWSFLVANPGTTTVSDLAVDDATAGPASCPATTLGPRASTTCTATAAHVISQADVDAGVVSNTATARGTDPGNSPVTSAPSSTDTPVQRSPGLQLTKSAVAGDVDGDGVTDLGDTVSWTFLVANTGTVTVSGVTVADPKAGPVTCPPGALAPGASVTCTTADHVVSQADVDAGRVDNTATASANTPTGSTTSNPSSTTTPIQQSSAIALTKSAAVADADGDGQSDLGDVIQWSFLVTNTGSTTVTTVSVNDPTAGAITCPTTTLAPGASATCTAAGHSVTQADVDAGVVSNTATATANDPSGTPLTSAPSSTDTPIDQVPSLALTKSAVVTDVDGDGRTDRGDRIQWSFAVSNTGTTSLAGLAVSDPMAGAISCPVTSLARGTGTTCTAGAPYVISQADVDGGIVSNVATAAADDPAGHTVTSPPSSTDTPVSQSAGLSLVKQAAVDDLNHDGRTDRGDDIRWSFLVTNTGTTTVHALAVDDPTAGAVSCPVATLAPGASTTCTADLPHGIAQADVDGGAVTNTATASALDPGNAPVTSSPSSTDTPVVQSPALTLAKSAAVSDIDADGRTDLGDTITWSFLVANSGTTTVHNLAVADPTAGAVSCPVSTLAPGSGTICTAVAYVIGQADVDAGVVSNTAHATALDPTDGLVRSPDSSTDTPVAQAPALSLLKSAAVADVDGSGATGVGDTITWSFAVTNTGTTTVTGLGITDATAGTVTCPVSTLAPGAATTCTSSAHVVTQADVDAGTVSNTATAHASTAGSSVVSSPSSTDTPIAQATALAATKQATVTDLNGDSETDKGDRITWSVTVTNTGTVTLHGLTIDDPKAGSMSCVATDLAPGASTVCIATTPYTITQPDVDARTVDNTATANAVDPGGAPVTSPPASVSTRVVAVPALTLTKQAATFDTNGDGTLGVGDTISWTFVVTNAGSLTLTNAAVSDPTAGTVTCPVTTLAPDESTTCTASAPHVVTQADVDLGVVTNTATASADDPSATAITSLPSSTDTALDQLVQLRLVKHGAPTDVNHDGITDAGDTILWSFDVTNTGRVTLTDVNVTDTKAGPVTCLKTTLAVGESTTCTATAAYTITGADAAAGAVHNVATAVGACGCRAAVKAVKAAAVVATKKQASGGHGGHPSDPADPPPASRDPIVPGLPFTGAMGVAWAVRGGLMALLLGGFLLVVGRRRRDDEEPDALG